MSSKGRGAESVESKSRLTVVRLDGGRYAIFLCACGIQKRIRRDHVAAGKTRSCGCLASETTPTLAHGANRRG